MSVQSSAVEQHRLVEVIRRLRQRDMVDTGDAGPLGRLLADEILQVLQRLRQEGLNMLLVEQNAKLTFEATSECLVMENGEVAMVGSSGTLRRDVRVRRIYLGL
jgi:branched-chain amino acid transport system ATP-binding protein